MKHVVNFSGGDCSFWAAHRVIEQYGKDNVVLLFADTLEEDESLYAFVSKSAEILGVPITRISEEKKIWDLFVEHGMIGNSKYPICSVYLKREPLDKWHREHCIELDTVLYLGFDWTEPHRTEAMRAAHPHWRIESPMQWEPIWDKCRMRKEAEALGLPEQQLYKLGFPHNNCGGCCVRAGISHWVHLYKTLPHRFSAWRDLEKNAIIELTRRGIDYKSILKDRRGGQVNNLTLAELERRILAGEQLPKHEWGGCGCGGSTKEMAA